MFGVHPLVSYQWLHWHMLQISHRAITHATGYKCQIYYLRLRSTPPLYMLSFHIKDKRDGVVY